MWGGVVSSCSHRCMPFFFVSILFESLLMLHMFRHVYCFLHILCPVTVGDRPGSSYGNLPQLSIFRHISTLFSLMLPLHLYLSVWKSPPKYTVNNYRHEQNGSNFNISDNTLCKNWSCYLLSLCLCLFDVGHWLKYLNDFWMNGDTFFERHSWLIKDSFYWLWLLTFLLVPPSGKSVFLKSNPISIRFRCTLCLVLIGCLSTVLICIH